MVHACKINGLKTLKPDYMWHYTIQRANLTRGEGCKVHVIPYGAGVSAMVTSVNHVCQVGYFRTQHAFVPNLFPSFLNNALFLMKDLSRKRYNII